jgi:hypothetical protein
MLVVFWGLVLVLALPARGHWQPGQHNAIHAINLIWCGRSNVTCAAGLDARAVSRCESGAYWWTHPTWAHNGEYQGMFQMGWGERQRWGHGPDPWTQARAAYKYWLDSGRDWSPWGCKPW